MPTLRDTIKETVRHHLKEKNGIAMGHCLTAVGWVGGTLPELYEDDGMVELSMADVAGGGIAVGAALAGRRTMYVIRYQGSLEYKYVYDKFMSEDEVYYVSEHRGAYNNTEEMADIYSTTPKITLFPISITRFAAIEAAKELQKEGINVDVCHILQIKPFEPNELQLLSLKSSGIGIVLDDDYVDGIAKSLAFDLNKKTGADVHVMGLDDKTAGFYSQVDNLPPSKEKIIKKIRELL